jgi:formate hydrogenlyase subunit 4
MLNAALHLALLLGSPLLFVGLVNRVKAAWAGRRGAPITQPYRDWVRLLRKGQVISQATSPVFRLAPAVNLAAVLLAGLMVPLASGSVLSFEGDFVVFAYVLATGRFCTILAAMDTGSSFEGMGASREALFAGLVEPAFFLLLAGLMAASGQTSLADVLPSLQTAGGLLQVALVLGLLSLFIMLLVEGCRVPVDDPNTHLELTMIHEVMVLDHSGPDLAFIQYAAALKMVIVAALMAGLVLPPGLPAGLSFLLTVVILAVVAVVVGLVESTVARLRMTHVSQFIFLMTSNALIVLAVVLLFRFGGLR